jgi:hypothetical protein
LDGGGNGGGFDELRPGADDRHDSHLLVCGYSPARNVARQI